MNPTATIEGTTEPTASPASKTITRSFKVQPANENAFIEMMEAFKYKLKSSQHVRDTDSHLEEGGPNTIKSVTTTTEFVKLLFERTTPFPNQERVLQLEQEYDGLVDQPRGPSGILTGIGMIFGGLIVAGLVQDLWSDTLGWVVFVLAVVVGVLAGRSFMADNRLAAEVNAANQTRRDEILAEARTL